MATAYPGALDTSGSQLRTDIASTDDLDATGKQHDVMHVNVHGATIALETKLGIGASAASGASDGDALTKQADGSTAWEAVPSGGVSWSGSTANGLATYGSSSSVVSESTATYDGTTLQLTTSGGGLKLDGLNSSNANTLDDYEEGTSTGLVLASSSGSMTLAADNNTLAYVRIGRLVFVQGTLELTSVSSPSGTLRVGGLPFTIANDIAEQGDRGGINTFVIYMATAVTRGLYMHNVSGQTYYDINEGDGATTLAYLLANQVDGGTSFIISGSYYAAA